MTVFQIVLINQNGNFIFWNNQNFEFDILILFDEEEKTNDDVWAEATQKQYEHASNIIQTDNCF